MVLLVMVSVSSVGLVTSSEITMAINRDTASVAVLLMLNHRGNYQDSESLDYFLLEWT